MYIKFWTIIELLLVYYLIIDRLFGMFINNVGDIIKFVDIVSTGKW